MARNSNFRHSDRSESIKFPVKVYPNPRISRPKTTKNWRTSPSYLVRSEVPAASPPPPEWSFQSVEYDYTRGALPSQDISLTFGKSLLYFHQNERSVCGKFCGTFEARVEAETFVPANNLCNEVSVVTWLYIALFSRHLILKVTFKSCFAL